MKKLMDILPINNRNENKRIMGSVLLIIFQIK